MPGTYLPPPQSTPPVRRFQRSREPPALPGLRGVVFGSVLLNREQELRFIDRLLADVRAGEGGAFVLRGDPGIGLTTLLHHLAVLRQVGLVTVRGGHPKLYRVRRERVAALSSSLEAFLRV